MNPFTRRRRPLPGQSRPDGFHLERIPVTEIDPGDAERWQAGPDLLAPAGLGLAAAALIEASLDRIDQGVAALRKTLTDAEAHAHIAVRDKAIGELVAQLRTADRVLGFYNADPAVLAAIKPSSTALLLAGDLTVGEHPDRC